MGMTIVVDAENVRRSVWPNVGRERLVELCAEHAARAGAAVVVVFDGAPPEVAVGHDVRLLGKGGRSADDLIAALAAEVPEGLVVATSDRGLRARLPGDVGVVGGGRFVRLLLGEAD
jgi:predicted RNA-binding protein with PIN domain